MMNYIMNFLLLPIDQLRHLHLLIFGVWFFTCFEIFKFWLAVAEVFSLKRVSKADTFFQSSADSSVERLAKFFEVSSGGFQEQLHRLRPLAEKRCRDINGGTREAWTATMKAIAATQSRNSLQDCSAATEFQC